MRTTLRMSLPLLLGSALLLCSSRTAHPQDLIGAQGVLDKLQIADKAPPKTDQLNWPKSLRELPDQLEKLDPPQAAATWLKTYDAWIAAYKDSAGSARQISFEYFIGALPPPAAWPELVKLIDDRPLPEDPQLRMRELLLRILGHRLVSQPDQERRNLELALSLTKEKDKRKDKDKEPDKTPVKKTILGSIFGTVVQTQQQNEWRSPVRTQLQNIKREIDPASAVDQFKQDLQETPERGTRFLNVPDLVAIIGREQAYPLLKQALFDNKRELNFSLIDIEEETATLKFAREIARKDLPKVEVPQWDLCHSIETTDLFEAFRKLGKKFPGHEFTSDWDMNQAAPWYLIGLIVKNRHEDAVKFLTERDALPGNKKTASSENTKLFDDIDLFEKAGYLKNVHAFLAAALKAHPNLTLWSPYVNASARLHKSPEALAFIDIIRARKDLSPETRLRLDRARANALIAADRVDEGVEALITLMKDALAKAPAQPKKLPNEEFDVDEIEEEFAYASGAMRSPIVRNSSGPLQDALRIAEIGRLLNRDEWIRLGSDTAEKLILAPFEASNARTRNNFQLKACITPLISLRQFGRAEQILTRVLSYSRQGVPENVIFYTSFGFSEMSSLELLARVYHAAGRSSDVVILLEHAPWWGRKDVASWIQPLTPSFGHHDSTLPFTAIVAQSLAAVGRKTEARSIVEAALPFESGSDPLWQLALDLMGEDFDKFAQKIFERDRFEERPLIWQARFYLNRNQLPRAEELIRQAISIDPSDGEQGRGDRMRAYAILAEILRKKSDEKTAKIYDGAIRAIRLSEEADTFYTAGLLSQAIKMYSESLTYFADAYCIQSRLALRLVEQGDLDAAAAHYQRAFELMPDSFGRVESHCFGCEGVFQGPIAGNIASRVFTKLVADRPKDPKVHYLLGYLYSSQQRNSQARTEFQTAVQLDPDYLNAWEHLLETDGSGHSLPPDVRDEAFFNLLRLDPAGRHTNCVSNSVRDLSRLWTTLHENEQRFPHHPPEKLFELKAVIAKQKTNPDLQFMDDSMTQAEYEIRNDSRKMRGHIFLEALSSAMGQVFGD